MGGFPFGSRYGVLLMGIIRQHLSGESKVRVLGIVHQSQVNAISGGFTLCLGVDVSVVMGLTDGSYRIFLLAGGGDFNPLDGLYH